jgi:3'-5' exoribonuclease
VSHHGDEEGAIKQPMTREAALLHFADNIDAQYNAFTREFSKIEDSETAWTNYVTLIDRYLYRGPSERGEEDVIPGPTENQLRRPSPENSAGSSSPHS